MYKCLPDVLEMCQWLLIWFGWLIGPTESSLSHNL